MLKSLVADLRATRTLWGVWLVVFFLCNLFSVTNPVIHLISGVVLTLALLFLPLIVDDSNRTQPLLAALPLGRGERVRGRYLYALLAALVGWGCFRLEAGLATRLFARQNIDLRPLFGLETMVLFLAATLLAAALFFPFYYRWGMGKGLMIAAGVGLFLLIDLTLAAPSLESFLQLNFPGDLGKFDFPPARLFFAIGMRLRDWSGSWPAAVFVLGGVAALFTFSAAVSAALYSRREL